MKDSIHEIVREAEQNYVYGTTKKSKYVDISIYEIIQTEDAYLSSKHITGLTDSLGREKPFFNVVTGTANIWFRATDLDRKNAKILPKKQKQTVSAFIATVLLQDWMDRNNFGQFLNDWGKTLARHGSCIVKFIERDGDLIPSVVSWLNFVPDPVDFNAIPKIEKFYKNAAQLKNMATKGHPDYAGYDMDAVEKLIKNGGTSRKLSDGESVDNLDNFFEIFEVHGYLSEEIYKKAKGEDVKEGDELKFSQQIHVGTFINTGEVDEKGNSKYDDYTLYCGKEKQDPYMITHLIEEDGRVKAIGAVEYLFDAQWMQNHTLKQWKDQLDLASKIVFQTADANFVGRNVLSAIENGDILVYADNKPISQINNASHDSASLQNFSNVWKMLEKEITSTPDAMRGNTLPSGTPYRLGAILQQEAASLFELMTENKGLALEQMLRKFVIPHLRRKLKGNKEEIMTILDDAGIKQIDSMFIPREAIKRYNNRTINKILNDDLTNLTPFDKQAEEMPIMEQMGQMGNQRFIKPDELDQKAWDEVIDDEVWDNLFVETTGENKDKNAVLTSLSSLMQQFAQADPPFANLIRNKIATETGVITPLEISSLPTASPPIGGGAGALPALAQTK